MAARTLRIDGLSVPVRWRFSDKAKHGRIVLNGGELEVIYTNHVDKDAMSGFLQQRRDWISAKWQNDGHQLIADRDIFNGTPFPLLGREYEINLVERSSARHARLHLGDDYINVILPTGMDEEDMQWHAKRLLKRQAHHGLEEKLYRMVRRFTSMIEKEFRDIRIRQMNSRWGSCTSDGTMCFNLSLAHAPIEVLRYVAAHECAHLRHMGHDSKFWNLVGKMFPDYEEHRHWLTRHGHILHGWV
jgi:predicted metal-dependent hydrolase